ncbi:MAG TPA: hypothetical protein VII92_13085, partial [Anaerolineae bacterium]
PTTADAQVTVHRDHTVVALGGRAGNWTRSDTWRLVALIAAKRQKMTFGLGEFTDVGDLHARPESAYRDTVLHFATDLAGGASDASAQVDEHRVLFRHRFPRSRRRREKTQHSYVASAALAKCITLRC